MSEGNAGKITINASDSITLEGVGRTPREPELPSRIGAVVAPPGTGNGGEINITKVSTSTGGNVNLQIAEELILRDNSTISAQALETADGGNVNINANFIVAFPNQNNDIIAAAARGNGGKINITTNSIFGLIDKIKRNYS